MEKGGITASDKCEVMWWWLQQSKACGLLREELRI